MHMRLGRQGRAVTLDEYHAVGQQHALCTVITFLRKKMAYAISKTHIHTYMHTLPAILKSYLQPQTCHSSQ